ncbi:hypothetical protein [Deinococcus sp. PEB2-63]
MRNLSTRTAGFAPILLVLFLSVLLISMLAISTNMSLSSRRTAVNQGQIMTAQYAAESEMNLLRSRFKDIQNLLSNPSTSSGYLRLPPGSLQNELRAYAVQFCGKSAMTGNTAWTPTSDFATPRGGTDTDLYPNAEQCVNDAASNFTNEKYGVLADSVDPSRYTILPSGEQPAAGASRSALMTWWENYLAQSTATYRYGIEPDRVVNLNGQRYRFYVRIAQAVVSKGEGAARRVLAAQKTEQTGWWFEFEVPNPFENVVFDNTIPNNGAFTSNVFDGDYFTNQKIRVYDYSNVQFKGKFSSAGCTTFPTSTAAAGTDCPQKSPGFYVRPSTSATGPDASATGFTNINTNLKNKLDNYANFAPDKAVNFQAAYIKLPSNASQQQADANAAGLVMTAAETGVKLVVGDANGNPLTASAFNSTNQKWNEPSPTYQYIRLQGPVTRYDTTAWSPVTISVFNSTPAENRKTVACGYGKTCYYVNPTVTTTDTTREFRYGPDKVLYQKTGTTWTIVQNQFNGVVFSGNGVKVGGPERPSATSTAQSNMPPAVASFAKLNVTSNGDIKIASDLTLSDLPCENSTFASDACTKKTPATMPQNILGLFTPTGDISISTEAPNNVNVYAAMMSSGGGLGVDDHDKGSSRGTMKIVGSVVENAPGLKGTSSGTGYTPSYTYDNRFKVGILPPSSPVTMVWKASDGAQAGKALSSFTWTQATTAAF